MDETKDCKSDTFRSVEIRIEEDTSELTVKLEEEDDVPPDFFDDFSNQDFMDGLNIVDAWEENEAKPTETSNSAEKKLSRHDLRNTLNKIKTDKPPRKSLKMNKEKTSKDRRSKSKESNKNTYDKDGKKDNRNIRLDANSSKASARRDPFKTKRDILRDKDKCAKDMETKAINEKLKVVETGLVPPGTEMDVDLQTLPSVTKRSQETVFKRSRSKSPLRNRGERPKRKSLSKERSHRTDRVRIYSRSPRRSRSSSLRRRLRGSRERIFSGRTVAEEHVSRYSPTYRRKYRGRDTSPLSNLSEREMWLRNRPSPSRRWSRSPSYKRNRGDGRHRSRSPNYRKSRRETSEEKKSFLKEIHEKLNETRPPMQMNPMPIGPVPPVYSAMSHAPGPVPVPVPVPVHNQYFQPLPQMPQPQPYDQEFFIGNAPMPPQPVMQPVYNMQQHPMIIEPPTYNMPPRPVPAPDIMQHQEFQPKQPALDEETVNKLFEDKKISLSEFLSITAKGPDSPQSVNIQKRKVLDMCEGALKLLGGGNMTGRLVIRRTVRETEKAPEKFVSPLRKKPFVRFQFTSPAKLNEEKLSFTASLVKLLHSVGIPKECANIEVFKEVSPSIPSPTIEAAPPAPRINNSVNNLNNSKSKKQQDSLLGVKYKMKMVQTEPYKCPTCALRNDIIYLDEGSQCEKPLLLDTATQVNEEDISPQQKIKGIPRNQSLAHLTPAQILAAMNQESSEERHNPSNEFQRERFERYSAGRFDSGRPNRDDRYLGERYQSNERFQQSFERYPENDRFSTSDRMSQGEFDGFAPNEQDVPYVQEEPYISPGQRYSPDERYMRSGFDGRPPERFNDPRMHRPDPRMNENRNRYFEDPRQNTWMQDRRRF